MRIRVAVNVVKLTASSTFPNSSNFWRRAFSSVCQARPLKDESIRCLSDGPLDGELTQ
jgi:hypothetical protein